jgi:hypothetical protein
MKLLCSSKEESFLNNIFLRTRNALVQKFTNSAKQPAVHYMEGYLGKNRQNPTKTITTTHATTVCEVLTGRVEGVGHKLYMDNFFSSSNIFDDLYTRGINCCGTDRIIKECHGALTRRHQN